MESWVVMFERLLPIMLLVIAVVGAPALMLAPEGLPRLRSLSKELAIVQRQNAELRREIRQLRAAVDDLRKNPRAVERIARDELGLVRPNELVFQFSRQP